MLEYRVGLGEGDWIALLDHDDVLAEHALFWVAEAINRHPDAALVYSDEDKITSNGVRCSPHFKPDWNYELFLGYNLICHLGVYRKSLISSVGGFQEGMEGAQDYDLALRCTERIEDRQIVHIPRVLYHWRMHPESTAIGGASKPYALPAGERALNQHFERRGIAARAQLQVAGYYRTAYARPAVFPLVSLIIVPRKAMKDRPLGDVVETLRGSDYPDKEILIADDHPIQHDAPRLGTDVEAHGAGEAQSASYDPRGAADLAVSKAKGEIVVLLDPALSPLSTDWLWDLVIQTLRPGVGAVGPRIVDRAGRVLGAGAIFGINGTVGRAHGGLPGTEDGYFHRAVLRQALSAISPECVVVRKSLFQAAGGLAGDFLPWPLAVADLCLRLKSLGCRNVYVGDVAMRQSAEIDRPPGSREPAAPAPLGLEKLPAPVRERWWPVMQADPAYNPNLTLHHTDFSLAWPPRTTNA